jgi:hypothetical protein
MSVGDEHCPADLVFRSREGVRVNRCHLESEPRRSERNKNFRGANPRCSKDQRMHNISVASLCALEEPTNEETHA